MRNRQLSAEPPLVNRSVHVGGWFAPRCRAIVAAMAAAMLFVPMPRVQAAEVLIGLNGARPSDWPILGAVLDSQGFTQQGWFDFASRVGRNWLPGLTSVGLDYPAQLGPFWGPSAMTGDQSLTVGQRNLHAAIMAEVEQGNTVAVTGLSMGTMVLDKEIAYLKNNPDAPPSSAITFYIFGGEARGFGQMYMPGVTVPYLGVTFDPVAESQYDVVVVYGQWDGWANPPDRPWHLLAVANAVMGVVFNRNGSNDHSAAASAGLDDAVLVSQTTNSLGATTTAYIIPNKQLPLTRPLLQLGVPRQVVDVLDSLLLPVISAGYSTMTPDLGPHFEHGRLVWPRLAALAVPPTSSGPGALAAGADAVVDAGDEASPAVPESNLPFTDSGDSGEPKSDLSPVSAPEAVPPAADSGATADNVDSAGEEKPDDRPAGSGTAREVDSESVDAQRAQQADVDDFADSAERVQRRAAAEFRNSKAAHRKQRDHTGADRPANVDKPEKPAKQERAAGASHRASDAGMHGEPSSSSPDR